MTMMYNIRGTKYKIFSTALISCEVTRGHPLLTLLIYQSVDVIYFDCLSTMYMCIYLTIYMMYRYGLDR